jgi:DNA-binding CsgD family transcriptional regulator
MDSPVRYVRSRDGTRIAYCLAGDGRALVYLQVPSLSHIELYPRQPGACEYLERLGRGRRLVRIDFRGTGMSEREYGDHSPDALTDDIEAVLDGIGIDRFDLVAGGARVTPALGLALRRPAAVNRVVLAYPYNVRPESNGQPPGEPAMVAMMQSNWELYLETTTQRNARRPLNELQELMAFVRRCMDQQNSVETMRASRPESDWAATTQVEAPVLVLEFPGNVHVPRGRMEAFAERFPRGRFMAVPESAMAPPYGDGALLVQAVMEFLGPPEPLPRAAAASPNPLTAREHEILRLLAAGRTQPEIASALCISAFTVSRHVVNLYAKIGAHRRAEAVSWAIHHGVG